MNPNSERFGTQCRPGLRGVCLTAALAVLILVAGCTTYPPAPREAVTADYAYQIGPLDTLNVIVFGNPELSMQVPVRPDGKLSSPLVQDVQASGKTPTELSKDIETALGKFIRDPKVTIVVTT
ncbi:MAG TPA: polysaccharide biosynthesis/export family protein, partial [Casimicrobiaceae bacterium]|nr:polysaccharide biosynthesis/export family protein [Casimicrobiaceae bacterium]